MQAGHHFRHLFVNKTRERQQRFYVWCLWECEGLHLIHWIYCCCFYVIIYMWSLIGGSFLLYCWYLLVSLVLSWHSHLLLTFFSSFLSFSGSDTDVFTPQLQTPITTQLDQQQHMELVQWWVESKHAKPLLTAMFVPCALTPAVLRLSPGQFVQRRIQPLHPVLSQPAEGGVEVKWSLSNSGIGWSVDAAGQVMRSSTVEMIWPPVSITTSPRETKQTEAVNTVGPICCPFYWRMHM